jgi:hypothetical protein
VPDSNIAVIWTPISEWLIRCGCKNGHQKDMCLKEIGLQDQNMLTILGSIANMIGGDVYDHLMSAGIFTLIISKIFLNSEDFEANGYGQDLFLLIMSH